MPDLSEASNKPVVPPQDFEKYAESGAYHWAELQPSWRVSFNPYLLARYSVALEHIAPASEGQTAVDLGCGDGYVTLQMAERGYRVKGLDGTPLAIELARKKVRAELQGRAEFSVGNVLKSSFNDHSAELVISLDVIEHLEDPEAMLAEIARIAKPGAMVLIGTPVRITEKPLDRFHVQEFYTQEFTALLSKYLEVQKVVRTHPMEWLAIMKRKVSFLGKRKNLGWNLINLYYLLTRKNLFVSENCEFPTYQLAVCKVR